MVGVREDRWRSFIGPLCPLQAAEAYTRGDKEYAACMSMKGKEHRQRMQELNGEAAQKLAQSK